MLATSGPLNEPLPVCCTYGHAKSAGLRWRSLRVSGSAPPRCQSRFSEFSPMSKAADNAKREVWTWPAAVDSFPPIAPGAVLQRKGIEAQKDALRLSAIEKGLNRSSPATTDHTTTPTTVASRLLVSRLGRLPPKSLIARLSLTSRPRERSPRESWEGSPPLTRPSVRLQSKRDTAKDDAGENLGRGFDSVPTHNQK